jgi:hypothetical protein
MARTFQVTFDARNPRALADFWSEALGYVRQSPPPGYDTWDAFAMDKGISADESEKYDSVIDPDGNGPRLFFQKVPEEKAAKNRMHLDVNVAGHGLPDEGRRAAINPEVERLVDLGATRLEDFDLGDSSGVWTVMQDPEGNEFCVQ